MNNTIPFSVSKDGGDTKFYNLKESSELRATFADNSKKTITLKEYLEFEKNKKDATNPNQFILDIEVVDKSLEVINNPTDENFWSSIND